MVDRRVPGRYEIRLRTFRCPTCGLTLRSDLQRVCPVDNTQMVDLDDDHEDHDHR